MTNYLISPGQVFSVIINWRNTGNITADFHLVAWVDYNSKYGATTGPGSSGSFNGAVYEKSVAPGESRRTVIGLISPSDVTPGQTLPVRRAIWNVDDSAVVSGDVVECGQDTITFNNPVVAAQITSCYLG